MKRIIFLLVAILAFVACERDGEKVYVAVESRSDENKKVTTPEPEEARPSAFDLKVGDKLYISLQGHHYPNIFHKEDWPKGESFVMLAKDVKTKDGVKVPVSFADDEDEWENERSVFHLDRESSIPLWMDGFGLGEKDNPVFNGYDMVGYWRSFDGGVIAGAANQLGVNVGIGQPLYLVVVFKDHKGRLVSSAYTNLTELFAESDIINHDEKKYQKFHGFFKEDNVIEKEIKSFVNTLFDHERFKELSSQGVLMEGYSITPDSFYFYTLRGRIERLSEKKQ